MPPAASSAAYPGQRCMGTAYVEDCRRCVKKGPRGRSSQKPWSDDLADDTLSCSKRERSRSYATSFRGIFRHCGSGREPLCGPIEDDYPATDGRHSGEFARYDLFPNTRNLSHLHPQRGHAAAECMAAARHDHPDPRHRCHDQGRHERRVATALYAPEEFQGGSPSHETRGICDCGLLYRLRRGRSRRDEPDLWKGNPARRNRAPDGKRTKTVRCKTDVQTAVLDYDRFKELYFQNPQFGFRLLHLVVARLQTSSELPQPAASS